LSDTEHEYPPAPSSGDNYEAMFGKLDMLNLLDIERLKAELPEYLTSLTERHTALLKSIDVWVQDHTPTTGKDRRPVIKNDDDKNVAADFLKQIKEFKDKDCEPQRKAIKANVLGAGEAIDDHFRGLKDPLDKGIPPIVDALSVYLKKQADAHTKMRQAEVRRLADEANQARERATLAASDIQQYEWERIADERQKAADAAARKAGGGTLEATRGKTDSGVHVGLVTVYKWEVAELMDLVLAVGQGKAPLEALAVNEPWMNHHCRTKDGERPGPVPGIHIYPTYKPK
jgi:hypothetical protein